MTCPVPGCTAAVADRRPVCSPHWREVPQFLQAAWWRRNDEVTRAFIERNVVSFAAGQGAIP